MIEFICENCGEAFETTSHRAKYCSPSCKQQAYRSRQEDEALQDDADWTDQEEDLEYDYEDEHGEEHDESEHRNRDVHQSPVYRNGTRVYRNTETGSYDKNGLRYGENDDRYGSNSEDHRNGVTERYDKSQPRYGRKGAAPHHLENFDQPYDPRERRRYPLNFYSANGMFTAQAIEQLPRLDQLALKHKPARYSDEEWFEYLGSINGIPVNIYEEAQEELEQEQQQAAIAEMNARILRWFPQLLEFTYADEIAVDTVEKLLIRIRSFVRSDRFQLVPSDHPHRLELLAELDVFTGLVEDHQDQGHECMILNPTESFLERMEEVISAARKR